MLFAILIPAIIISGCIDLADFDPSSFAKKSPVVREFLEEHPNAGVVISRYTKNQTQSILEDIREKCDNPYMEAKELFKVKFTDPDTDFYAIAWIDWKDKNLECAYKKTGEVTENCTSHHEYKCYNEHVYWYDSCGERGDRKEYCEQGCEGGECIEKITNCTSHHDYKCYSGHVYWFDSCGKKEEKKEHCEEGCEEDECIVHVNDTEECWDSDGGKYYFKKGTVTKSSESYSDSCNSDGTLSEKYCENNEVMTENVECPDSYECSEGRCIGIGHDLAVLDISMEPEDPSVDETVFLNFMVENLGNAKIDKFDWVLNITGNNDAMALNHPLGESQEDEVIVAKSFVEVGIYNFTFRLDPYDKIDEINEDNNVISGAIRVITNDCIGSACTIYAGESKKILVNDTEYEITVLGASSESKGILRINGYDKEVDEGLFYTVGGLEVYINNVDYKNSSSVLVAVGENPAFSIGKYANLTGGVFLSTVERGLFVGNRINSSRDQLTVEDLSDLLKSGLFKDYENNDYPYTQFIILGSSKIYADYIDIGVFLSKPVYRSKIVFNKPLDFSDPMVNSIDETLELFGSMYTIVPTSTNDRIDLHRSSATLQIIFNDTKTATLGGQQYQITMTGYNETTAFLKINGGYYKWDEGKTYVLPGSDFSVYVADLYTMYVPPPVGNVKVVKIIIGDPVKMENGEAVQLGADEEEIDGTLVNIEKAGGGVKSISVSVAAEDTDTSKLYPGGAFKDPVWGTFELVFNHPTNLASSITLKKK